MEALIVAMLMKPLPIGLGDMWSVALLQCHCPGEALAV